MSSIVNKDKNPSVLMQKLVRWLNSKGREDTDYEKLVPKSVVRRKKLQRKLLRKQYGKQVIRY